MADWKRLTKRLILADGVIEDAEAEILREEFLGDNVVTQMEAEFLLDLRDKAVKAVPDFHRFVFEVVKRAILKDGVIDAAEAEWIKEFILADGGVDDLEKAFLLDLHTSAKRVAPEFEQLVKKYAG